jgi:hypothetical protein
VTYRTQQVRHQSSALTAVLLQADTAILYAFDLIRRGYAQSPIPRPQERACPAIAQYRGRHPIQPIHRPGRPCRLRAACWLGADCIVSKKVNSTYRSGACRVWIKVRNPAGIAAQREGSEIWNR